MYCHTELVCFGFPFYFRFHAKNHRKPSLLMCLHPGTDCGHFQKNEKVNSPKCRRKSFSENAKCVRLGTQVSGHRIGNIFCFPLRCCGDDGISFLPNPFAHSFILCCRRTNTWCGGRCENIIIINSSRFLSPLLSKKLRRHFGDSSVCVCVTVCVCRCAWADFYENRNSRRIFCARVCSLECYNKHK